jgi:hypothetical protein
MRRRYILHIGARIPWAVVGDAWRRLAPVRNPSPET